MKRICTKTGDQLRDANKLPKRSHTLHNEEAYKNKSIKPLGWTEIAFYKQHNEPLIAGSLSGDIRILLLSHSSIRSQGLSIHEPPNFVIDHNKHSQELKQHSVMELISTNFGKISFLVISIETQGTCQLIPVIIIPNIPDKTQPKQMSKAINEPGQPCSQP